MAGDIFISHSSKDIGVAETICAALESRGLTCWISSRDVDAGENFAEAIVEAISVAKAMLLVFSASANNSNEIKKELVVASHSNTVVVPVRVEDVVPSGAMRYELATRQWIDLFADWEREIDRLARRIKAIVAAKTVGIEATDLDARTAMADLASDGAPLAQVDRKVIDRRPIDGEMLERPVAAYSAPQPSTSARVDSVGPPRLLQPSWTVPDPSPLVPVESPAAPRSGGGSAVVRFAGNLRRRPLIVLGAAACLAVAVVAAIIATRQTTPAVSASPPAATGPGSGETVGYVSGLDPYGDNYLSLRTGPGSEYPEIYRMGENTFVRVIISAGKWTQIRLNGGQTGWAFSQYLRPGFPH